MKREPMSGRARPEGKRDVKACACRILSVGSRDARRQVRRPLSPSDQESRGRSVGGGHMIGYESEQQHSDQLPRGARVGCCDLPAHVLDFAQELSMKFEMMKKERDPRLGHHRFL